MTEYELAILYRPDLESELDATEKVVADIIKKADGKIIATDNWGKRKTAYPVEGHDYAVYVFYTVEMPGEKVSGVNDILNITDGVIRFLITKPDLKARAKAEEMTAKRDQRLAKQGKDDDKDSDENEEE